LENVHRRCCPAGACPGPGHAAQHPCGRHRLDRDPRREPRRVPRPCPRRLPRRGNGRRLSEIQSVAPGDVDGLLGEGAQLIDVRTDHEWEAGRIAGAEHIELGAIGERIAEIDRGRPVLLYCRGDNRSDMAAAALAGEGYDARVLAGGIEAWADDGRPLEPDGGYVAESGEAAAVLQARKSP